ncbi:MAG: adenylosuccinate lyase [Anaerolineae bacterium]|nr:adenylosuccinate lyase [Anaerolineae bacterium]
MNNNFDQYLSPYSWRYASPEMRQIWSEMEKRRLWRSIWVALAETEKDFNLVKSEQVEDLKHFMTEIDIPLALQIESEIKHDLMAEVKAYALQCPVGGGILHLGATSMDIEDNADTIRVKKSLELILGKLKILLGEFSNKIEQYADLPIMGYTHIQPAEPTTLGYRFASYAQDILDDYTKLKEFSEQIKGKGFKGAVGTGAAYAELVGLENLENFEQKLSTRLGIDFYPVTTQTYPRKQDYRILCLLAGLGASFYKFAFDLRLMQMPAIGEWSEPFGDKQIGSSAMPFKRNPVKAEKVCSLARTLSNMPQTAWSNASHSLLERTLDDSANRRSLLPEAFLICDDLIKTLSKLVHNLNINETAIKRNLDTYAPFAATERVMMNLGKAGANRQVIHESLRQHALSAWQAVQMGNPNPLKDLIRNDPAFSQLSDAQLCELFDVKGYTGLAPAHARDLAKQIKTVLA